VGDFLLAEKGVNRLINGVKVGNDGIQLISNENEIINQNGGTTTPVFVVAGQVRSTPPPIGIPD